ncbi:aldehyde dehydrogenase [Nocardioides sp. Root614]|nr:aldehyde dehydrogenase [Nocardioides sp. Root614]KRA89512.1 aldehyde dehydrogenase [Nocardioides sp. Root682]
METIPVDARADAIAGRMRDGEIAWARTPLVRRAELLTEFQRLVDEHAAEWVEVAASIKQLPPDSPLLGEEWMSGPWATLSYLEPLRTTLERLDAGKDPLSGFRTRPAPGDRLAIQVLPHTTYDRLLLNGYAAEVWMQPGVSRDDVRRTAGLGQLVPHRTQGTALVLGAGNITSIAPLDVLYVLYADNRVAALKLNPIMDPLLGVFTKVFKPFIDLGVVEIFSSDVALGSALAHHRDIAAVHMTGSEHTHDAIVWGPGEQGRANKAAGTPLLAKPISSELGGVAPVIVVPGAWSRADLRFQAQHVATQRLHNGGHNCIAAQVVILSSDWAQKDAFLAELRSALAGAPARPAWYPGCDVRVAEARRLHPDADLVGGTAERTLLPGLDLQDPAESAFSTEYFGPVLGVTELPGEGAAFLEAAVAAANATLRGTLGANVIAHPRSLRKMGRAFREILADLRYGTIGVNVWTGVGYLTPHATWGGFPGHALDDIQSGRGVVHNALLLERTERTVVTGPFRPSPRSILHGELSISPKPPWFVDNRTASTTGRRLTRFAARPRWRALPAIFASALRG